MGAVYFYHLTRSSAEATLRVLLPKARAAGWLVEIRGPEERMLDDLDKALWLGDEESFLAHGRAGGPHDGLQPILLTSDPLIPPRPCIISTGGAQIAAAEVAQASRACILFDGHEQTALERARAQWKSLTSEGCEAQYWAEDGARWEMRASSS